MKHLVMVSCFLLNPALAWPQHEGHLHQPAAPDTMDASPQLFQSDMAEMAGMTNQEMEMAGPGRWQWMGMAIVRLVYNHQGGESGDEALESSNRGMGMVHRTFGTSRVTFMLMTSLEPATIPEKGSPELFQTGETFEEKPLVDRQHPHDFFSNLSATYRLGIAPQTALWLQVAPRGEPALGPTAYMHRASTGDNPTSPLGHHWQDSSHITNNVVTVGGGWRGFLLEGSAFHGREPDEERWNIEGGALDSFSGRLKVRFRDGWSAQVSYGYLHEPEALEEGDTHRTTASIHYGADGNGPLAATLLWGQNRENHGISDSFLAEAAWQATTVDQAYMRLEYVEKDEDLLATKAPGPGGEETRLAGITALTAGYLRDFPILRQIATGLGGDITFYGFPSSLDESYGESPISVHGFLRLRWNEGHGHGGHD